MKTLVILSISSLLLSANSFSQNLKPKAVWLKLESNDVLPLKVGNKFKSIDNTLNSIISKNKVKSVEYVFSNSKNPELQKVVEFTCDCDAENLYSDLVNKAKSVRNVQLAPVYKILDTPNDYSIAFSNDYALNLIGAQGAWNITTGSPSVIIGISDQNFYATHEELSGKVLYYDATNTASKIHGTAVAITAAGNTNNSLGKSSIGYNSSLKLFRMNFNDALAASYAGARVLNLSWSSSCSFNPYAQAAIDEIWNNGTFIVASAGNGTTCGNANNLVYPAAYDHVFSVTSIGPNDNHERIPGNASTTHQHNSSVDICAPGYNVAISTSSGSYSTSSGTSFAAPYVSGTVALMLAANPCLTNAQIESILKESAVNIDNLNPTYAGKLGAGRLNSAAAVAMASNLNSLEIISNVVSEGCEPNSGKIDILNAINNPDKFYSYTWSNGATSATIDSLANGIYTVIVSDGCATDTASFVIDIQPTIMSAQIINSMAPMAPTGSINLSATGLEPFSFIWNNGSTTEDLSNITSGNYFVIITNANGCSRIGNFYVDYNHGKPRGGN